MQENNKHTVTIEQRKRLLVTAVESVVAFSEVKILLSLVGGGRLSIVGTNLKITGFSKASGEFVADGSVTGITYGGKTFVSKLFK